MSDHLNVSTNEYRPRRRAFMKQIAWATGAGAFASRWPLPAKAQANSTTPHEGRKLKYVGWQVGMTYQVAAPGGLDRDYLMRLLDEMTENKMNMLSLMMNSTASNDPVHDGYCWPVQNPRLKAYWDATSTNGQPSTEFLHDVIAAAADRKIQIHLLMNGFWWTPEKIKKGYPSAECQCSREQATEGSGAYPWWFCPDSPDAWQAGLDEVADLLTFYRHPNVIGYGFEMLCYGDCFCKWTREKYRRDTGQSMFDAKPVELHRWRSKQIREYLKLYADHIRRFLPNGSVWLHSDCYYAGHEPDGLQACDIDYVLPMVIHMQKTKEEVYALLKRIAPNPCVLHFCTRDKRPENYPLWIKTPEIIAKAMRWVLEYPFDNLAGLLFFNESATSPRNKKAVYEQIKRFDW